MGDLERKIKKEKRETEREELKREIRKRHVTEEEIYLKQKKHRERQKNREIAERYKG